MSKLTFERPDRQSCPAAALKAEIISRAMRPLQLSYFRFPLFRQYR
jgi:hypothetical protein